MEKIKFYNLTNDKVFKAVFSKESNYDLLEKLIYEVTDIVFNVISVAMSELPKNNIYKKGKILDVIAKTEDNAIVNIELNNLEAKYLHRRNVSYIFSLYSEKLKTGETYQGMPMVIQINLTKEKTDIPLKAEYTLYDKENKIEYIDNFKIYELNLQKAKEKWYNKSDKKRLIALLDCNEEELNNAMGDDLVEKLKKEVIKLNEDVEFVKFLSDEDEERLYTNSLKQEGFEEGIEEGIEQGIEQGRKQEKLVTAKNMLGKDVDINFILEVTGLSIEEIEKLK